MKLLIDQFNINSATSNVGIVNPLTEETKSGDKKYYIEGVFMQAEKPNRNGRIYPKAVMEKAVNEYQKTISAKRALGEMLHPSHPHVNLERASHIIESLTWDGNDIIGRARIMTEMPMGKIAKGLIDEGVQLGVSSRGLGSLKMRNGVNEVQNDFMLNTVDIVGDPSAPDAWVNAVMEGAEWVFENGMWKAAETSKKIIESVNTKQLDKIKLSLFQNFLKGIK